MSAGKSRRATAVDIEASRVSIALSLNAAYQCLRHKKEFTSEDRLHKLFWMHLQNSVNQGCLTNLSLFQVIEFAARLSRTHKRDSTGVLTLFQTSDDPDTYDIGPMIIPDYSAWEDFIPPNNGSMLTTLGHPSTALNQAGTSGSKKARRNNSRVRASDCSPADVVSAIDIFEDLPISSKLGLMDRFDKVANSIWFTRASIADRIEYIRHVTPFDGQADFEAWRAGFDGGTQIVYDTDPE